jgi:hypothetical protein
MAQDLLLGFAWGVDSQTVGSGAGLTQPQVLSAVSVDPNTIRVTFSQDMLFVHDPASVLIIAAYTVDDGSNELPILWVSKYSDTQVELHTTDQSAVSYTVTVAGVKNAWGTEIDTGNNTASFTGTAHSYPTGVRMDAFFGLDIGVQAEQDIDFSPDLVAPYLANQSPGPGQTGVAPTTLINLDILDDDAGVDVATVVLKVNGVDAYKNEAAQAGFTVQRTTLGNGYRFSINPDVDLVEGTWITIAVTASDAAVIPNTLNTSYQFQTSDVTGPYLQNQVPAPFQQEVSVRANVTLEVVADGLAVDPSTVIIRIDGIPAWSGGVQQPGFAVTDSAVTKGYKYVINPVIDFTSAAWVTVGVYAEDTSGNPLDTSYQFQAEDLARVRELIQVQAHAPSLIVYLAQDFGIEVDTQESEDRQRSWVRNVSKWIGLKGTEDCYNILANISGFIATVDALYKVTLDLAEGFPPEFVYFVPEMTSGRVGVYGTDGQFLVGTYRRLRFKADSASFKASDLGLQLQTDDAQDAAHDKRYTIDVIVDEFTIELRDPDYSGGVLPDYGIGGSVDDPKISWALGRIYATQPPKQPLFDEFVADVVTQQVGPCPADPCFALDKFCWEDDFAAEGPINILAVNQLTEQRWEIEASPVATPPNFLEAPLGGTWEVTDNAGTVFYIEEFPLVDQGGGQYSFEVETTTAPITGVATLRYVCPTVLQCGYCQSNKVRLIMDPGTIADESGVAVEKAFERALRRIRNEIVPAHVDLIVVFRWEFEAYLSKGGRDASLYSGSIFFYSPSADFDDAVDIYRWLEVFESGDDNTDVQVHGGSIVARYSPDTILDPARLLPIPVVEEEGDLVLNPDHQAEMLLPSPNNPEVGWQMPIGAQLDSFTEIFPPLYAPLTAYFDEVAGDDIPLDTTIYATIETP